MQCTKARIMKRCDIILSKASKRARKMQREFQTALVHLAACLQSDKSDFRDNE